MIFFQGYLWLYNLEVNAYHLEQLSCIVKIILYIAVAKWMDSNKLLEILFLHYFYQLG